MERRKGKEGGNGDTNRRMILISAHRPIDHSLEQIFL
jgi:hypothetical protein